MSGPDAAREAARRPDGQFGTQERDEAAVGPGGVDLTESGVPSAADRLRNAPDTLVKPPRAAVSFAQDAEDAGYDVQVTHDAHCVSLSLSRPGSKNTMSVVWAKGHFHDEPLGSTMLGFHTETGNPGVRFDYAQGFVHGEWVSPRSARQARLYMGLPEK